MSLNQKREEKNFAAENAKDAKDVGAGLKPALLRGLRDLRGEKIFYQVLHP
jgi:hypothetical protein